jgi:PPOX class probable F420-dependent enzyme
VTHLEAARKHIMWFGSYARSGELKKVQVWCIVHDGCLEFLTDGASLKVKRVRRNPSVICFLGSSDGPQMEGTAEILRDFEAIEYGIRAYWKTHPLRMTIVNLFIKRRVKRGEQVLIRVTPDEPNPLAGVTEPKL